MPRIYCRSGLERARAPAQCAGRFFRGPSQQLQIGFVEVFLGLGVDLYVRTFWRRNLISSILPLVQRVMTMSSSVTAFVTIARRIPGALKCFTRPFELRDVPRGPAPDFFCGSVPSRLPSRS